MAKRSHGDAEKVEGIGTSTQEWWREAKAAVESLIVHCVTSLMLAPEFDEKVGVVWLIPVVQVARWM